MGIKCYLSEKHTVDIAQPRVEPGLLALKPSMLLLHQLLSCSSDSNVNKNFRSSYWKRLGSGSRFSVLASVSKSEKKPHQDNRIIDVNN